MSARGDGNANAGSAAGRKWVDVHLLRDYCENVKNITVTLDDNTYRRARVKAAETDTSVSALVKQFLSEFAAGETEFERLKRKERTLRAQITTFRAADRLPRGERPVPRR